MGNSEDSNKYMKLQNVNTNKLANTNTKEKHKKLFIKIIGTKLSGLVLKDTSKISAFQCFPIVRLNVIASSQTLFSINYQQ